jgi:hypothetical protein
MALFIPIHNSTFKIKHFNFMLMKLRQCPAPTDCKHTVSGSISLPSRGAFHLSLTVLFHYRSPIVFSLTRWSSQIQPEFLVFRFTRDTNTNYTAFKLRDFHPLRSYFPERFVYAMKPDSLVPQPPGLPGFRLFRVRSPLLTESLLLSFPPLT